MINPGQVPDWGRGVLLRRRDRSAEVSQAQERVVLERRCDRRMLRHWGRGVLDESVGIGVDVCSRYRVQIRRDNPVYHAYKLELRRNCFQLI